jgi:hypothetical protein
MTAQWKKFNGTDEQIKEMENAEHGYIFRYTSIDGMKHESGICRCESAREKNVVFHEYLICEPIPHADMIIRQAQTGQPVYYNANFNNRWMLAETPSWDRNTEYSFSLPKEKKYIEVKDYLYEKYDGTIRKATAHKDDTNQADILIGCNTFIRWLDDDWRKVEV